MTTTLIRNNVTERDPLAAMIMRGPLRVDYSFINGRAIIRRGAFVALDIDSLLESHAQTMQRIYVA